MNNPLVKKKNILLKVKPIQQEVVEEENIPDVSKEVEEVQEVKVAEPDKDDLFVPNTEEKQQKMIREPTNIIEADQDEDIPKKKKKRKLSEKQLAHLARMREKALEKRKRIREAKEAEKEKKRLLKEEKRKLKEQKQLEKEERKKQRELQKKPVNKVVEKPEPIPKPSTNSGMGFNQFFDYMQRYERIKQVRTRQNNRNTTQTKSSVVKTNNPLVNRPAKPKNKYLGTLIPF